MSASMEKVFAFPVKRNTNRSHNFSNVIEQKQTQPKKILIVEINEVLLCLYKMELVEEGYITLEASNARKAIKTVEHLISLSFH